MSRIYCINGRRGHGKTLNMVKMGIEKAEENKKYICSNIWLDVKKIHNYAIERKMRWVAWLCRNGGIILDKDLNRSINYEDTVNLIDELGVICDARDNMQSKNSEKHADFFVGAILSRKAGQKGQDIIWTSQDWSQVDVKLRRLTDIMGWVVSEPVRRNQVITWFDSASYEKFLAKKSMGMYLKSMVGMPDIGLAPKQLYGAYDTLERIAGRPTMKVVEVVQKAEGREVSVNGQVVILERTQSFSQVVIPAEFPQPELQTVAPGASPVVLSFDGLFAQHRA